MCRSLHICAVGARQPEHPEQVHLRAVNTSTAPAFLRCSCSTTRLAVDLAPPLSRFQHTPAMSTAVAAPATTLPPSVERQISPRHFTAIAPSSTPTAASGPLSSSQHDSAPRRARSNGSPENRPALERTNSNGKSSPNECVYHNIHFHQHKHNVHTDNRLAGSETAFRRRSR